jgi:hypothetical protein
MEENVQINIDFPNVFKWRYLDSLDSVRFSDKDLELRRKTKTERIEQASIEICATILMGNGIIVPNNQLFDSFGFLRIASEMIKAATFFENKDKHVFLPLRYANFDYSNEKEIGGGPHLKDPYLLVAYLLNKDGSDNKKSNFELSTWTNLGPRRRDWAKVLMDHCIAIPNRLIDQNDYYEKILAEDLVRILHFFNGNRSLITNAAPIGDVRQKMVKFIAGLTTRKVDEDKFFANILGFQKNISPSSPILFIANVLNKLEHVEKDGKPITYNRTNLRDELFQNSSMYFDVDPVDENMARIGILDTIDSIYNFSGYIGTRAVQDKQTTPMIEDNIWGYDEAAFALGQWAREMYFLTTPKARFDISADQDVYVNPNFADPSFAIESFDGFWNTFFEFQCDGEWSHSLEKYSIQLKQFERMKILSDSLNSSNGTEKYEDKLLEEKELYEEIRQSHITLTNKFLNEHFYRIEIFDNKLMLVHFDSKDNVISKTQIEDFASNYLLSKEERSALHARELAKGISSKGRIAEFGE